MGSVFRLLSRMRLVVIILPCLILVLGAFGTFRPGANGEADPAASVPAAGKVAGDGEAASEGARRSAPRAHRSDGADWPMFGRKAERTHYAEHAPNPPFHRRWEFFSGQLLEFPPALSEGMLYVVNKTGHVDAVRARSGESPWGRNLGNNLTAPTVDGEILYLAERGGRVVALDKRTGHTRWTFDAKATLESSPLVIAGTLFFGTDDGDLLALDADSGKVRWKRQLAGSPVKASPTHHGGTIYVGDYAGTVHAVAAKDGSRRWSLDTTALAPGGSGGFYSSPAVAFGRIYEARDDGTLYALTLDGKLDWHLRTGGPIYGSPAVADVDGAGPSVYIGSYDHHLYALDAQTGRQRWAHDMGGGIVGTATVIGGTVYTASLDTSETRGLNARTGERVWRWGTAGFTPMITDGRHNFLSGYQTIWAFDAKRQRSGR